jgi:hypothetical protein
VKAKWLTLLFVGSLGLMVWVCRSTGTTALAGEGEAAASEHGSTEARRRALELLRQATTELQANHLDVARQLAKQANDLNATYSLFDVRPEHVLAEIERKERDGGAYAKNPRPASGHQVVQTPKPVSAPVATASELSDPFALPATAESSKTGEVFKPLDPAKISDASRFPSPLVPISQAAVEQIAPAARPASPPPIDPTKARAIAILDRGLQALDEQRFDDAEGYARAALSLHASFSKLEYKPEYLITEVGIARARQRLDAATSQTTVQSQGPTQSKVPASPADRSFQRPAPAPPTVAAATPPVAHPYSAAQSAAVAAGAASSHERAERLLQEALADLHAGRDDVARARIEGALGVIHSGTSQPPARFPGNVAAATPPVAMAPGAMLPAPPRTDPPQAAMPRAGFLNYVPDPALNAHDAALKPLHDPYLGDDPTTTQKSTAGENSLRETLPTDVPLSPTLSLNRPLPRMSDELAAPPTTASKANYATPAGVSQTQAVAAGQNPAARVRWPESDAAPASATAQAAAAPTTPGTTPAPSDVPSPSARYSYAPVTSSSWAQSTSSADDHPGFFHRVWTAITGE